MYKPLNFDDFQDWIDACIDTGFKLTDLLETTELYSFEAGGFQVAYWDRQLKRGFLIPEDLE